MTVLAVLQNMWVKEPEKVRAMIARTPQVRRRLITYSLFAGCRTGRVLKQVFGDDCRWRFVWEESTTEIAGNTRDVFLADPDHLRAVLKEVQPDVVLSFGRIASDALMRLVAPEKLICGPHPTARQANTHARLRAMAEILSATDRRNGPSTCSRSRSSWTRRANWLKMRGTLLGTLRESKMTADAKLLNDWRLKLAYSSSEGLGAMLTAEECGEILGLLPSQYVNHEDKKDAERYRADRELSLREHYPDANDQERLRESYYKASDSVADNAVARIGSLPISGQRK